MDRFVLRGFPMPPSSNNQNATVLVTKKTGQQIPKRIDSRALKEFKAAVEAWHWQNAQIAAQARSWAAQCGFMSVSTYFLFARERLLTKDGQLKQLDASNRIKACHDALALVLDRDDRWFISGTFEKAFVPTGTPEQIVIVLSPAQPRLLDPAQESF